MSMKLIPVLCGLFSVTAWAEPPLAMTSGSKHEVRSADVGRDVGCNASGDLTCKGTAGSPSDIPLCTIQRYNPRGSWNFFHRVFVGKTLVQEIGTGEVTEENIENYVLEYANLGLCNYVSVSGKAVSVFTLSSGATRKITAEDVNKTLICSAGALPLCGVRSLDGSGFKEMGVTLGKDVIASQNFRSGLDSYARGIAKAGYCNYVSVEKYLKK